MDDLSVESLKEDMDDKIWNNEKIFSIEKPWYYYVKAFKVKADANAQIKLICGSANGLISISECEMGLLKVNKALKNDIKKIADDLKSNVTLVSGADVSAAQMESVWDVMVGRLLSAAADNTEDYVGAEPNHPSWWQDLSAFSL